jgi:hypothetical protein
MWNSKARHTAKQFSIKSWVHLDPPVWRHQLRTDCQRMVACRSDRRPDLPRIIVGNLESGED